MRTSYYRHRAAAAFAASRERIGFDALSHTFPPSLPLSVSVSVSLSLCLSHTHPPTYPLTDRPTSRIVAASHYEPTTIIQALQPYLNLSRPIVIYHGSVEVSCMYRGRRSFTRTIRTLLRTSSPPSPLPCPLPPPPADASR